MNLVIDGPEKAGKSTTIAALKKALKKNFQVDVLKWGPVKPDDRVYTEQLMHYAGSRDTVAIWDRCWPSEYVYGKLLGRKDHRMSSDPWLGAWLHDRAVISNGSRFMMLGPSIDHLSKLRDSTDLAVSPENEVKLYKEYATRFGWTILEGYKHTKKSLDANVDLILREFYKDTMQLDGMPLPPAWAGPQDAKVVIVGNTLSEKPVPGGWLPFTSRMTTMFGRIFGDDVVKYGWTNARDCSPAYLKRRKVIIACGNIAHEWIRHYVAEKENYDQKILYVPHPSWLFRFKNERTEIEIKRTIENIKSVL